MPKGICWNAHGTAAGYALVTFAYFNEAGGLVLWIEEIYVRPAWRGRGIGREVLTFLEDAYRGEAVRIRLEVESSNEGALRLYRALGFEKLEYLQMYKPLWQVSGRSDVISKGARVTMHIKKKTLRLKKTLGLFYFQKRYPLFSNTGPVLRLFQYSVCRITVVRERAQV